MDRLPPGPKGLPFIGSLLDFFGDMLVFLSKIAEDYGDVVHFKLGPEKRFLINHPDLIKDVLITDSRNFSKSRALERSRIVLGNGILTSEGEFHLRQRRIIQPAFHRKRIETYAEVMADFASRMSDRWRDGQVVDMNKEMMELTLSIIAKTMFGTEVESEVREIDQAVTAIVDLFPRRIFPYSEILDRLPLPANIRCERAIRRLDETIYRIIDERRKSGEDRGDVLSMLLLAQDESGEGMTDEQVRDEAMTLFLAGHETTANALTWTWYLLSQNPEAERKLHEEIDNVLGDSPPSASDMKKLTYTEMVLKESMRLYPPVWAVTRRTAEDYEVDRYVVPSGCSIFMSQYVMHRDSRYYHDPLEFLPARWNPEMKRSLPRFSYFPFGGGPRKCIGDQFAMTEGTLILAALASKWKMTLFPGHPVELKPLITLRPKHGLKMMLERR